MHKLFPVALVCGLSLADSHYALAQAGKVSETSSGVAYKPTTDVTSVDMDTTGLLIKPSSTSEKLYVADQCFTQLNLPVYKKQSETDNLRSFVARNLEWPDKSGRWDVEGKVYVRFIVD